MKNKNKYIFKIWYQVFAHLLIVLIMSIPVTQLFHHHVNSTIVNADDNDGISFDQVVEKCKLCDYLIQKHGEEFLLPSPSALNFTLPQPIKIRANIIAGNYTFTLQVFTNRGPPAMLS